MPQRDAHVLQGPFLAGGIHAQRHRGAGAQTGQQEVVGGGAGVVPDGSRLVGAEHVPPGGDALAVGAAAVLGHHDEAVLTLRLPVGGRGDGCWVGVRGGVRPVDVEVPARPGREHRGGEAGISGAGEEVVGAVEGDERLRVASQVEDLAGVLDPDRLVDRRVHHQQGSSEPPDPLRLRLAGDVVEELLADPERSRGQADLGLALLLDLRPALGEQVQQVLGPGRRPDGGDGPSLRYLLGGGEDRGATQ